MKILGFNFEPRNEGEQSVYEFKILPTTEITDNHNIIFIFPDVYDKKLTRSLLKCKAIKGLEAEVGCTAKNNIITVTGLTTYVPNENNPLVI